MQMMNLVGYERNQLMLILNYKNLSQDLNSRTPIPKFDWQSTYETRSINFKGWCI